MRAKAKYEYSTMSKRERERLKNDGGDFPRKSLYCSRAHKREKSCKKIIRHVLRATSLGPGKRRSRVYANQRQLYRRVYRVAVECNFQAVL